MYIKYGDVLPNVCFFFFKENLLMSVSTLIKIITYESIIFCKES